MRILVPSRSLIATSYSRTPLQHALAPAVKLRSITQPASAAAHHFSTSSTMAASSSSSDPQYTGLTTAQTVVPVNDTDIDDPTSTVTTHTGIKLTAHNQYKARRLLRGDMPQEPLSLFGAWLADALNPTPQSGLPKVREPEAMALSTATASGIPSSRIVLLKEVDKDGFVFFTNYNSRKGRELTENPHAALVFYWREAMKQIRVVGHAERVSRAESVAYFTTRPRGSQLGAWASTQSSDIDEEALPEHVAAAEERFKGQDVPCPEHWGGFRIVPFEVEFWAGQPSRLHDRFRFSRPESTGAAGEWAINRLAP